MPLQPGTPLGPGGPSCPGRPWEESKQEVKTNMLVTVYLTATELFQLNERNSLEVLVFLEILAIQEAPV